MNPAFASLPMTIASPFGRRAHMATAYHQIGVSTGVSEASPHKLVVMLFDGYIDAITEARGAMRERRHEAKGRAIGRAVSILGDGLRAGLDLQAGGALAADLDALYGYVIPRLSMAGLKNDEAILDECQNLIEPLRSAWKAIASQAGSPVPQGAGK